MATSNQTSEKLYDLDSFVEMPRALRRMSAWQRKQGGYPMPGTKAYKLIQLEYEMKLKEASSK